MPLRPPEGDWPPPPGPLAARLAPDRILTRMAAVPDAEMREALWREILTALPPAGILPIIAAVRAAGATTVHQYAVVFDGKRCFVETVPA